MKRSVLVFLAIFLCLGFNSANAGFSIGGDLALPYGLGFALGYDFALNPVIDLGFEFSSNSYTSESFKDPLGGNNTGTISGSRYGVTAKFNLMLIPLKIHAGLHSGNLKVNSGSNIKFPGTEDLISSGESISGSYVDVGLDYRLGPVFLEPRIGIQSITAKGKTYNLAFPSDIGFRFGLAF